MSRYMPEKDFSLSEIKRNFDPCREVGEAAEKKLIEILSEHDDSVEVKRDKKYPETGNLCIEYAQSNKKGGDKPSGINTSKSGWWAIWFTPDSCLLIKRMRLIQAVKLFGRKRPTGDNGNKSALVSLIRLIQWLRGLYQTEGPIQ